MKIIIILNLEFGNFHKQVRLTLNQKIIRELKVIENSYKLLNKRESMVKGLLTEL